jgi:hypothetical protein
LNPALRSHVELDMSLGGHVRRTLGAACRVALACAGAAPGSAFGAQTLDARAGIGHVSTYGGYVA